MEKSAQCPGRINPSFSSSLLDAIYRSIDESNGGLTVPPLSSTSKRQIAAFDKKWISTPSPPGNLRRHVSSSSSSECSSFGGFSSSDADSTARPRSVLTRCDRGRADPPPERKRSGSVRSRIRDLRNSRAPASPGARLAAFLNAIFSSGGGKLKKPKLSGEEKESVKSCVGKKPASLRAAKQRSVRFSTTSTVSVEDSCEKRCFGEDMIGSRDRLKLMELLRGFDMDEEEEESDCESVSSSDLFELENLSAIGHFKDELPVYKTTNLSASHVIAKGYIV